MTYDLIVVGGGVTGSSLARRMAASGASVLVVERESRFHDRIRGEAVQPWGVAEIRQLGIADVLKTCSAELRWFAQIINGQLTMRRDMIATTPQAAGMWTFYHPQAQERLLASAADAGAEVMLGASVYRIVPGPRPTVTITTGQASAAGPATVNAEARLIAICAGRNPSLRTELGFEVQRGSIPLFLSGIWLTKLPREVDFSVAYVANNVVSGAIAGLFPQKDGRARAYFGFHPQACTRLQGVADFPRFLEECNAASCGSIHLDGVEPEGPLASFECVDVWVNHPYRNGVALLGDAAASNDPSWGQGLSLSFRDARVLSDELLATTDWNAAADRYAQRHDEHYGVVRKVTGWFYDMFQRLGPESDARRARALPLIAQDPTRVPDVLFSGPEFPLDANSRARFFGEASKADAA